MSWKGTYRSISSTTKKIDRELTRVSRAAERQRKLEAKQEEAAQVAQILAEHEAYVEQLISLHTEVGKVWDWARINSRPPPKEPHKSNSRELAAQYKLDNYRPSRTDKMLSRTAMKRGKIQQMVRKAKDTDEQEYQSALYQYKEARANWETIHDISARILSSEPEAYIEAIQSYGTWREIEGLAQSLEFFTEDGTLIQVDALTFGTEIVPDEIYTQLKSGKPSIKPMPKTKYWALYQDYICGSAIRIARECFALIPTNMTLVSVLDNILNTKTGHLEKQPILSLAIPRETLGSLNLSAIDPSDAMTNFVHNMKFKKTRGFTPVERIKTTDLSPPQ